MIDDHQHSVLLPEIILLLLHLKCDENVRYTRKKVRNFGGEKFLPLKQVSTTDTLINRLV